MQGILGGGVVPVPAELGAPRGPGASPDPHRERPQGRGLHTYPPAGPSRPLRVRDEQANPTLIPDYVPREPLSKAGCSMAIRAEGLGMDPPIQEL